MRKGEGNTHLTTDRTRHYRDCPVCDGQGEVTVNASALGDPQCEEPAPCANSRCFDGLVIQWEDPLLRLASWRTAITSWRSVGYWKARHAAMKPVLLPPDYAVSKDTAAHFNGHRNVVMDVLAPAFAQVFGRAA